MYVLDKEKVNHMHSPTSHPKLYPCSEGKGGDMSKYVPQKPGSTWNFFKKHEVHAVINVWKNYHQKI